MEVQGFTRAYLARELGGAADVRVTVPNPRPARLVVVTRAGGGELDPHRDAPMLDALVWAPTEAEAATLATSVDKAMRRIVYEDGVAGARRVTLRTDPDPDDPGQPRWYACYVLTTYKTDGFEL